MLGWHSFPGHDTLWNALSELVEPSDRLDVQSGMVPSLYSPGPLNRISQSGQGIFYAGVYEEDASPVRIW